MKLSRHLYLTLVLDNLIIGRKIFTDTTLFTSIFDTKQVTISECVPFYNAKRIKDLSNSMNIKCIGKD